MFFGMLLTGIISNAQHVPDQPAISGRGESNVITPTKNGSPKL
jgi:hypothetical protein